MPAETSEMSSPEMQEVMNQQAQTFAAIREMNAGFTSLGNMVQTLVHTMNTSVATNTQQALNQQNLTVDKNIELVVKRLDSFKGEDFSELAHRV